MILVTGVTGTLGKAVLAEVLPGGGRIRVLYRSKEDAATAPPGTDAAVADFADKASLGPALRGVDSLFLVCSPVPDLVQLEGNVIEAAEAAGVRRIVLNSALGAGDYPKSFPAWHRQAEDKLTATKMAYCIVRPNSFMQNILTYYAPSIRAQGAFYGSTGDSRYSYIDIRDIAAVIARALQGGHDGRIYELNGPAAFSNAEVAEKISQHAGVAAKYVDIPAEAQRKAMLDQGMPEWQVKALLELQEYYTGGQGATVDGVVEGLLGRPAITLDRFLEEFAGAFHPVVAGA